MEVMMRASVVVVGEMNCDGVECKWSMVMTGRDMSIFDFGCRSPINLSVAPPELIPEIFREIFRRPIRRRLVSDNVRWCPVLSPSN
jgi:hypothetical protein